jgi:hypothetical protein
MIAGASDSSAADWDSRVLCIDDSCLGLLGTDGRCGVCGQLGSIEGSTAAAPVAPLALATDLPLELAAGSLASDDSDFADRELCPDDSCVGLLDQGGACKVCGARPQ